MKEGAGTEDVICISCRVISRLFFRCMHGRGNICQSAHAPLFLSMPASHWLLLERALHLFCWLQQLQLLLLAVAPTKVGAGFACPMTSRRLSFVSRLSHVKRITMLLWCWFVSLVFCVVAEVAPSGDNGIGTASSYVTSSKDSSITMIPRGHLPCPADVKRSRRHRRISTAPCLARGSG